MKQQTDRTHKNRQSIGHLMALIAKLEPGDSFLTDQKPAICGAYAARYGKLVTTQILLQVDPKSLKTIKITKVTIK